MKGKGFRVQLQAADRHNIDCYIGDKETLTGWVIDWVDRISDDQPFELHITKEVEKPPAKEEQGQPFLSSSYEVDLLLQQLLLFDCQQEMVNYVQTEKILANQPLKQLTDLSIALLRLGKQLLQERKPMIPLTIKAQHYTKEQLDRIQQECLNTLLRVKDQRKRAENCCICLSSRSNHIILPCMHLVLCGECSGRTVGKCPICGQPIREKREVFQ